MSAREAIFRAIDEERGRQDAKFGDQRSNDPTRWSAILSEECGEVAMAALRLEDVGTVMSRTELREELVQVAAVAVAWIEALGSVGPPECVRIPRDHRLAERGAEVGRTVTVCGHEYLVRSVRRDHAVAFLGSRGDPIPEVYEP